MAKLNQVTPNEGNVLRWIVEEYETIGLLTEGITFKTIREQIIGTKETIKTALIGLMHRGLVDCNDKDTWKPTKKGIEMIKNTHQLLFYNFLTNEKNI